MRYKHKWRVFVLVILTIYITIIYSFIAINLRIDQTERVTSSVPEDRKINPKPMENKYNNKTGQFVDGNIDIGLKIATIRIPTTASTKSKPLLMQIQERIHFRGDWQAVTERQLYVYSAYHDVRVNTVTVISLVNSMRVGRGTECVLWIKDEDGVGVVVEEEKWRTVFTKADVAVIPEINEKR